MKKRTQHYRKENGEDDVNVREQQATDQKAMRRARTCLAYCK